jgi:hypothetical protein
MTKVLHVVSFMTTSPDRSGIIVGLLWAFRCYTSGMVSGQSSIIGSQSKAPLDRSRYVSLMRESGKPSGCR